MSHWSSIAERWHLVGPPLRPAPGDIACFEHSIVEHTSNPVESLQALILGVTPELYRLSWPENTVVRALDGSAEMIEAAWPGPPDLAVQGSWTEAPFSNGSQDVVVCDGGMGTLGYPEVQRTLLDEVSRLLAPGGLFVVRLFAPGGLTGSVADIGKDLRKGAIPGLDALKLRLWGALQTDVATGVRPRDVVAEIERLAGGLERLVEEQGWSADHVATLALHRNSGAVYHLIDAEALAGMAQDSGSFELLSTDRPDHAFGHCCPVVSLRRVPGRSLREPKGRSPT